MPKEKATVLKRPSTWNSNRRGQVPKYVYNRLKDIYSSDDPKEFHNLYGVVIDIRSAEKSKGSGLNLILTN